MHPTLSLLWSTERLQELTCSVAGGRRFVIVRAGRRALSGLAQKRGFHFVCRQRKLDIGSEVSLQIFWLSETLRERTFVGASCSKLTGYRCNISFSVCRHRGSLCTHGPHAHSVAAHLCMVKELFSRRGIRPSERLFHTFKSFWR